MNWNPLKLDPPFKAEEGIIIAVFRYLLSIPKYPVYILHHLLSRLVKYIANKANGSKKTIEEVWEGYYIELWSVTCAVVMIYFVLPYFENSSWIFLSIAGLFFISRSADFFDTFMVFNFYLSFKERRLKNPQRSVARSYMILITNFLELAAIFASLHYIICGQFTTGKFASSWGNLYFYSIMNMLTIGDSNTIPKVNDAIWWFDFFKVVQPLFGGLFLASAISRIIDWKERVSAK